MLWIEGMLTVLLLQGREVIEVMPAITAVLFYSVLWIEGLTAVLLVQGRGEMAVRAAITSVS